MTDSLTGLEDCKAVDDNGDSSAATTKMNTEEMTTISTESIIVTKSGPLASEDITTVFNDEELPLCSEVVTSPPKIGVGLLSKFGVSPSTNAPVPCREDEITTTQTFPTTLESSGKSGGNGLLSSLADKFGK